MVWLVGYIIAIPSGFDKPNPTLSDVTNIFLFFIAINYLIIIHSRRVIDMSPKCITER